MNSLRHQVLRSNILRGCIISLKKSFSRLTHEQQTTLFFYRRPLTSSSAKPGGGVTASNNNQDDDDATTTMYNLLYHRLPSRSTPPRAMVGISTFNLLYWTWYVADFTPSVNASAQAKAALGQIDADTLHLLLIDPKMGYVGLGVSIAIWSGAWMYTRQLISAIWKGSDGNLAVSGLQLPFLTEPKVLAKTVYDPTTNNTFSDGVEHIQFTEAELKAESSNIAFYRHGDLSLSGEKDTNDILVKYDGDFSRKVGHLALKLNTADNSSSSSKDEESDETSISSSAFSNLSKQKYLLDIRSSDEIMPNASHHLLSSLVIREHHLMTGGRKKMEKTKKHTSDKSGNVEEESSDNTSTNVGRSIQKRGFRKRRNR